MGTRATWRTTIMTATTMTTNLQMTNCYVIGTPIIHACVHFLYYHYSTVDDFSIDWGGGDQVKGGC